MTTPSRSNPTVAQVRAAQSYLERVTAIQIERAQLGLTTDIPSVRRITEAAPSPDEKRVLDRISRDVHLHRESVRRTFQGVSGGQALLDVLEPVRGAVSAERDAASIEAFGDLPSGDEMLQLQLLVFDPERSSLMCKYEEDRLYEVCPDLEGSDTPLVKAAFALRVQAELQRSTPEHGV